MDRKRNKKKNSNVSTIISVVLILALFALLIGSQLKITQKERELAVIDAQVEEQKEANKSTRELIEESDSDEFTERMAREKLNYAYPDEKIIIAHYS